MKYHLLCEFGYRYLKKKKKTSPKLDLGALLDSKKNIEAVIKFLNSGPCLLS